MKTFRLHLFMVLLSWYGYSTNYYVSNSIGSDGNNGLSTTTPFKSVNHAANNIAVHGDTIFVMPGTYTNNTYGTFNAWKAEQAVRINNKNPLNGAPENYLVIKPQIPGTVIFKSDGNYIFQIRQSSYIKVEGFELIGERDNISLDLAKQYQFKYKDANGNELNRIEPGTADDVVAATTFPKLTNITRPTVFNADALIAQESHHIDFVNNTIHKSTSAGLRIAECDYVNIINNTIYDCNQRTSIGTPALVLSMINSIDSNDDVKIKIQRNKVYNNYNQLYSWNGSKDFITPVIDEGKGISLEHCITRSQAPSWNHGRVLIENNICYGNGFSGINTNEAERVDIFNNTCYQNIASGRGTNTGISVNETVDAKIINNICFSDNSFGGEALAMRLSSSVTILNNLIEGTIDSDVDAIDNNSIFENPLFENTTNFYLSPTSKAIDAADNNYGPSIDYLSQPRDLKKDIGAIEFISTSTPTNNDNTNKIITYPNPTQKIITIKNAFSETIQLFNQYGYEISHKITKTTIGNDVALNLETLKNGIYIIKINHQIARVIKFNK